MRGDWSAPHLSMGTSDYLRFTPCQQEWIRRRLRAFSRPPIG
jgi:hypothetical protein